ncbi:MAG: replicative DNA helicase [Bacteroides sp.]|nr:replicative DNA helicase [Eubacterium sp.]MCM1418264.1 replicative DNA helicase [Roseburia sp.]MCM1462353.1 replicative DNA helicase [Bacteroides sp.]
MADFDISEANLPFNIDAEQVVLGSLVIDPSLIAKLSGKLTPEHFHIRTHSKIFDAIGRLFLAGEDINIVSVTEACMRKSVFETIDEARTYLFKLTESSVEKSSIESYAEILDEKFLVRRLILASKDIYDLAVANTEEPQHLLDYAEKKIYEIRNDKEIKGLLHIGPLVKETLRSLAFLAEHPEEANKKGMSSGFPSLDKVIFGLNASDLILIAARPAMGKTAFALNIAVNAARMHRDKKVAVFNLEMSREQLVARMLSAEGRVSSEQMRNGRIEMSQWRGLSEAAEMLSEIELYVDDSANITIGEMKAKLRRVENLGLVVIDYLQLMSTGRRDGNRVSEVSELTRNLKIMAKELRVPIITLSQLSRGPEARTDKRPVLSDLRDSGSIEQDADIVLFLYRDVYYTKDEENVGGAECIVAKNRHGETRTVNLRFDGQFTRFSDVETRYGE